MRRLDSLAVGLHRRIRRASTGHILRADTAGERLGHFSRRAMASVRDEGGAAWLQPPRVLCGRELRTYADPERA